MSIRMLAWPVPVTRTAVSLNKAIKAYVRTLPEAVWSTTRDAGSALRPVPNGPCRRVAPAPWWTLRSRDGRTCQTDRRSAERGKDRQWQAVSR
ncbi:hypothetical protein GCM10012279_00150 [Micromonospora yangpuensis]|nr:hypothetical protein GCM10012279_00150 [Micromonospora yangpuensis]